MGHVLGLGITRGGQGQILRSCGPGDTDHRAVIPKMLVPRGPGRGQLLAHSTCQGSEEGSQELEAVGTWGWGCAEGWLGF